MVHAIFALLGTPGDDFPGLASAAANGLKLPPKARKKADVPGCLAELLGVVQGLLACEPARRLPARKALRDPFFAGLEASC